MRLCDICQDNKAVGKQTLTKEESPNPGTYKLCEFCAEDTERVGGHVEYYKYTTQYKEKQSSLIEREDITEGTTCSDCESTDIVGKQTLTSSESPNPGTYLLCRDCAPHMEQIGANITYFNAKDKPETDSPSLPQAVLDCEHDWEKHSLVSEVENKSDRAFDWCRCQKCKVYGKRFYLNQTKLDDLMMEIDIACCR